MAFVVAEGREPVGSTAEDLAAALITGVRDTLGPMAQPSKVAFVASLPKTRSGKIVRRLLRARELGQDVGDVSTLED